MRREMGRSGGDGEGQAEFFLESLEGRRLLSVSIELDASRPLTPGVDVHVSALAGDETEPAIAIDPLNPGRMFASANYGRNGSGLFAAYSGDAGASWVGTDVWFWLR